jgi:hypothetical protein
VDHGPAVLTRLPRGRRLRQTAHHAEIRGIAALRKVVQVAIAGGRHLAPVLLVVALEAALMMAAGPTAEDAADSRNPRP